MNLLNHLHSCSHSNPTKISVDGRCPPAVSLLGLPTSSNGELSGDSNLTLGLYCVVFKLSDFISSLSLPLSVWIVSCHCWFEVSTGVVCSVEPGLLLKGTRGVTLFRRQLNTSTLFSLFSSIIYRVQSHNRICLAHTVHFHLWFF